MDDDERKRLLDGIHEKERQLKKAQNAAAMWKYTAWVRGETLLFVGLVENGCIPGWPKVLKLLSTNLATLRETPTP